ncbi:DUF3578 domain-containing protein [Nannocystis sp. RBIL2]|uniref:MrcB family domain-containing protein n=1 Tax=Nannocystis sp. RBIL2 TaxID=2996788 RepID=UPI00226E3588|nr:DUF3578 domain-containing protein [Nannocystis sp. RBIL2]MCY1071663.1 DUF3578 domain-containing protein [Nannocystis sp. RBIL2]
MRAELEHWARNYPVERNKGDAAFAGSHMVQFVATVLPDAIRDRIPELAGRYLVKGSAGQGKWTFTPWVALLHPAVTTSVQDGYYIAYLMSIDGSSIYLTLNQGCTTLKNTVGLGAAREELGRRAVLMRGRIAHHVRQMKPGAPDFGTQWWRADLYTAGNIVAIRYDTATLPDEPRLIADLSEATALYEALRREGGWDSPEEIFQESEAAKETGSFVHAKKYRQHRSVERQSTHSKKVKKLQGYRCKGCDILLTERYGSIAHQLIEAHHLTPLNTLDEGVEVRFDPATDFAVLCPNCHAIIHRMDDPSDLEGLRRLVQTASSRTSSPSSG